MYFIIYETINLVNGKRYRGCHQTNNIEDGYFGCAGVGEIPDLQNKLISLARGGFKHHTTIAKGHYKQVLEEAFNTYLKYNVVSIDK